MDVLPRVGEGVFDLDFQYFLDTPPPKYNTQLQGHDISVITEGKKPYLDSKANGWFLNL